MSEPYYNEAGNTVLTRVDIAQIERKARIDELEHLRANCDPLILDNKWVDNRIAELKGDN